MGLWFKLRFNLYASEFKTLKAHSCPFLQTPHKVSVKRQANKQLVLLGDKTWRLLTPTCLFMCYQNAKDLNGPTHRPWHTNWKQTGWLEFRFSRKHPVLRSTVLKRTEFLVQRVYFVQVLSGQNVSVAHDETHLFMQLYEKRPKIKFSFMSPLEKGLGLHDLLFKSYQVTTLQANIGYS